MNHTRLGALLLSVTLAAGIFATGQASAVERDYEWAKDPRSLAPMTKGVEDLLPSVPVPKDVSGFGELLGEWTWTDLGIPGEWGGGGVSIDYPYLYLCSITDRRVYIIDISTGTPGPFLLWFGAPGSNLTWGLGMDNEQELWVGDIWNNTPQHSWAYEMTTYPPIPSLTGNSFNSRQGDRWMADMSDNAPWDTIYIVRVGGDNNIYAFHEPSGQVGRNFGDTTWNWISQRALAYNSDDGTLFIGGWNTNRVWEISMSDGAPLPGRSFYSDNPAGAAYQDRANGGPYLWIQCNFYISVLRKYRTEPADSCIPVEPWLVRTQGYWRRQCKQKPHEDICVYTDSVHLLADLFDTFDCDSICDLMNVNPTERDMCRKARRQFMALLLNIASGKLAVCNCLEDGREVSDVIGEIDSLLTTSPDFATCEYAKTQADDLNNGIGIVLCDTVLVPAPPIAILQSSFSAAPNPFVNSTVIRYEVATPAPVKLEIYDKVGRLVRALIVSQQESGFHRMKWDGLDGEGRKVRMGVYFSRIQIGHSVKSSKLILLR